MHKKILKDANRAVKPEDILPGDTDNFGTVRKASMASILANIDVVESESTTEDTKVQALLQINNLLGDMSTMVSLDHYIQWKNPKIQKISEGIKW